MTRNVVDVFNQLTLSEASGYSSFENILENHYNKFKYFYESIRLLTEVEPLSWSPSFQDTTLSIDISFETSTDTNSFYENLSSILETLVYPESKHFTYDANITTGTTVNITIANISIVREDELYEN